VKIVELIVDSDEEVGHGGFIAVRRMRLRNRREDGSISAQYCCDSVIRPYGQDAVVVAVFAGRRVLVREGMRPTLQFSRDPAVAPLPEPAPSAFITESVAGVIERGDHGEAGLRARAAAEVAEEAGFDVDPARVILLGAGMYPAPGLLIEKFYFAAVEVDPATQHALPGDGSPMEEGATTRWLDLDAAIAACVAGEIVDLKTEAVLRRLRDHLH
jgi:ADP-ribose pyrophosphatase